MRSLFLLVAVTAAITAQDLRLGAIFSDHMVLQREKPVPVWGQAAPGAKVTVEFAGQKKSATADSNGRWMTKLSSMKASTEPRVLTIEAGNRIQINDVLVGEVWLGSGQSNMALMVRAAKDFATEQPAAQFPLIRGFKEESNAVRQPEWQGRGKWVATTPETVGTYSAVLYFFGREVFKQLGGQVPVGLINSSVGGTPIESWIAMDAQMKSPELKAHTEAQEQAFVKFDEKKSDKKAAMPGRAAAVLATCSTARSRRSSLMPSAARFGIRVKPMPPRAAAISTSTISPCW